MGLRLPTCTYISCFSLLLLGACSDSRSDDNGTGGSTSTGGTGATGASGGSAGASGGSAGSGGSAAGGSAGADGGAGSPADSGTDSSVDVTPDPCPPPTSATDSSLCLSFAPESITLESDPALDGQGTLLVQIFDRPNPPALDSASSALLSQTITTEAGSTFSIGSLPEIRLVETFPSRVFLRVVFADNAARAAPEEPTFGTWFGGIDFSLGQLVPVLLEPVDLNVGAGNTRTVPLTAFRKLDVTVSASATPVGDGEGPLRVGALGGEDIANIPPVLGQTLVPCADLSGGQAVMVSVPFITDGPLFITGGLNDLGEPAQLNELFPGGLFGLAANADGGPPIIPNQLDLPAGAYSAQTSLDLGFVQVLPPDSGAPGPNACSDLGDGGTQ